MQLFLAFCILVLVSFVLSKSADLIIHSAIRIARLFHVSDFSVGFFVLGLATTMPELFVGINSAIDGQPQLSLGNLIGASIFLLTFIIGLNAVVGNEIHFINTFGKRDMVFTSLNIFSPVFFMLDGVLSRTDGVFLIGLYTLFFITMNKHQTFVEQVRDTLVGSHNHIAKTAARMIVGIIGLFISAKIIVEAAEYIAVELNLPLVLVGIVILGVGTNLPELTVMFKSVQTHHKQISLGNFLGSAAANTLVLGIVAVMHPISTVAPVKIFFGFGMLFVTLLTFNAYFYSDKTISRMEGIALISMYIFFIFSEFFLQARF